MVVAVPTNVFDPENYAKVDVIFSDVVVAGLYLENPAAYCFRSAPATGTLSFKYDFSDAAFNLSFGSQGISNPLQQSTVNVMKMVDPAHLREVLGAVLRTANNSNSEIYTKALTELGLNALVSSTVTAAARPQEGRGISMVVKTPMGSKLVEASKLLITVSPTLDNMRPFNLNLEELQIFSQWTSMGMPVDQRASGIARTRIPEVFYVWYRSPSHMTQLAVEQAAIRAIQNLQKAQNFTITTPSFIKFKSHTPFKLGASAQAIRDGFYRDLYAL
ncbi:hypothetical protein AAEP93_000797 [Penicillium crustosum]